MKSISLRELRRLVEGTQGKALPTARILRESGVDVVAHAVVGSDGALTVYKNGFYTYSTAGCTTVYAVDRCAGYAYHGGETLDAAFFEDKAWMVRLTLAGEDRLEHNGNVREENRHFSYSADNVEQGDLWDPFDFTRAFEDNDAIRQLLASLTDRQREVLELYYIKGMTQQEIAVKLGIARPVVCKQLKAGANRMKKLYRVFL